LAPAPGRRHHTTSPSAISPLVSQRIRVHRIPHSTFVTFAIAARRANQLHLRSPRYGKIIMPFQASEHDSIAVAIFAIDRSASFLFWDEHRKNCHLHSSCPTVIISQTCLDF